MRDAGRVLGTQGPHVGFAFDGRQHRGSAVQLDSHDKRIQEECGYMFTNGNASGDANQTSAATAPTASSSGSSVPMTMTSSGVNAPSLCLQ